MRVNSGVNPSTFTTDDPSTPAQDTASPDVPSTLDTPSPSTVNDKRFEGQLDAFMFRNHLDAESSETAGSASSALAAAGTPTTPLNGMRIGVNKYGEDIHVTKEVGSPNGYDTRLQAVAAARMSGTDPAALIQTNDSKWHAVETNQNFAGGLDAAADTPTRAVEGLPSAAHIDELRDKVRELKTELKQLNAEIAKARQNLEVASAIHQNHQDQLAEQLLQAEEELASAVLGIPREEIQINRSQRQDSSSKVNLDPADQMPGAGAEYFDTGDLMTGRPTISISLERLDKPKEAAGTLFHEISHAQDSKLAQKWLGQFRQEKTGFPNTPDGMKDFQDWVKTPKGGAELRKFLGQQPPSSLSKADAEVVEDAAAHANVSTEARAYTHASIAAMQGGDFDALKDQFKSYASAIKKGQTMNPFDQSETMKGLTQELHSAYRQMPKEGQAQFQAAVAAAKEVNPNAWISKLDFTK